MAALGPWSELSIKRHWISGVIPAGRDYIGEITHLRCGRCLKSTESMVGDVRFEDNDARPGSGC